MDDDRYCTKDDLRFLKLDQQKKTEDDGKVFIFFSFRNHVSILRGFPVDSLNEFPHAIQHCNYR